MTIKTPLPDGFKCKMTEIIGISDAKTLFDALEGDSTTTIRINRHKTPTKPVITDSPSPDSAKSYHQGCDTPIAASQVEWCDSAFNLETRPNFTLNPLLHAGAFYVQDASSTVYETIVRVLGFDHPVKVADLCAAPGGKTTAIINAIPEGSVVLANEYVGSRANILKENLVKYGYPDLIITNSDTSRLASLKGYFDLIVVDAPCSGEGMMRKEDTARAQWSEGLIRQCSALQRDIIDNAIDMLAPGGYLIYSTCTFNTEEDEDNAAYICGKYALEAIDTGLAGKNGIRGQLKGDIPCLRFMPGFTRGEGLFVTVFKKLDDAQNFASKAHVTSKKRKDSNTHKNSKIDARLISLAKSWIKADDAEIRPHNERLLALSPLSAHLLDSIPKDVRIMSAGVEVGEVKGKDLIPSHSLAMSQCLNNLQFPAVELPEEDALRYLSRESVNLPPGTPKGYVVATYSGLPLGFLKNLGNRSNNLYPTEYRIRTKTGS